jgi:hypothetical protein
MQTKENYQVDLSFERMWNTVQECGTRYNSQLAGLLDNDRDGANRKDRKRARALAGRNNDKPRMQKLI